MNVAAVILVHTPTATALAATPPHPPREVILPADMAKRPGIIAAAAGLACEIVWAPESVEGYEA